MQECLPHHNNLFSFSFGIVIPLRSRPSVARKAVLFAEYRTQNIAFYTGIRISCVANPGLFLIVWKQREHVLRTYNLYEHSIYVISSINPILLVYA